MTPAPWVIVRDSVFGDCYVVCRHCGGTSTVPETYEAKHPGTKARLLEQHGRCAPRDPGGIGEGAL